MPRFSNRLIICIGLLMTGSLFLSASQAFVENTSLVQGETGEVLQVIDGDTFQLHTGLTVRLSAMQSPKLPLGRPGFKTWPLADAAKDTLEDLALGKNVRLYYGGKQRDRYNRALAQVLTTDAPEIWIQEAMIRAGYGRVYTWPDTWQDSSRLYKAEQEARAAKRGIWADAFYAVRSVDPNMLAQDADTFQIVEGIIISVAEVGDTIFLNFGSDYRTDFTIVVQEQHKDRFVDKQIDLLSLEGASVRVRGWIEMRNGPSIRLDHPERLEILN